MYNRKLNRYSKFRKARLVNNIFNNIPNINLIIVKGCIEGNNKPLRILIDNFSLAKLISERAAKKLSKDITSSNIKLAMAQGASLEIKGQVKLDLSIGGHKSEVITLVVCQLSPVYDAILGIGWLNEHDTSLRTKKSYSNLLYR